MQQRRRKCSGVPHTDYRRKSHNRRESLCVMIYVGDAELYNFLSPANKSTYLSFIRNYHPPQSDSLCTRGGKRVSLVTYTKKRKGKAD